MSKSDAGKGDTLRKMDLKRYKASYAVIDWRRKDPKADPECPACHGYGTKTITSCGEYVEEIQNFPCHCLHRDWKMFEGTPLQRKKL